MSPTATRSRQSSVPVSDATIALDWRRKKNRRRFALKILVPLLVLVVIAAGTWLVGFSRVFGVRSVQVHGTRTLTAAAVAQAAAVPMDVPLARVDLSQIADRVDAVPVVESTQVDRSWPDTVVITVTERRPVFTVQQDSGYLLVDKHGVAYQQQSDRPSGQVLAGVDPGNQPLLAEVAQVVAILPPKLRSELNTVQAATPDSITLLLTGNRKVLWGDGSRSADKLLVLQALLKHKASSYDVSAPDDPASHR